MRSTCKFWGATLANDLPVDGAALAGRPFVRMSSEMLMRRGLQPGACVFVVVRGNAMSPTLDDGDEVLVATDDRQLADGALYALRVDGDVIVRRAHPRPGARVLVRSDHPQVPDYEHPIESKGFAIIGRVRWRAGWV